MREIGRSGALERRANHRGEAKHRDDGEDGDARPTEPRSCLTVDKRCCTSDEPERLTGPIHPRVCHASEGERAANREQDYRDAHKDEGHA